MQLAQWGAEPHGWQVFEQASFVTKQIGLQFFLISLTYL